MIPVSPEVHLDYAKEVQEKLKAQGIRVDLDTRDEKIGYKIREAQMQKSRICWSLETMKPKKAA